MVASSAACSGDEVIAVEFAADDAAHFGDEVLDADHAPGAVLSLRQQIAVHLIDDVADRLHTPTGNNHSPYERTISSRETNCVKRVCVQLPTSADSVALPAYVPCCGAPAADRRPCSNRSMSPDRRAHSSSSGRMGQTERRTDRQTADSCIETLLRILCEQ